MNLIRASYGVRLTNKGTCVKDEGSGLSIKALISILSLLMLLAFQNCAEPLEEEDASSLSANTPFAYETMVDTFAYMSCARMDDSVSKKAYFTFKVGALREGSGLRLRQDFLDFVGKKSTEEIAEVLANSEKNAEVSLQMAIRDKGYFKNQSAYGNQAKGGPRFGYEVNNFLAPLDSIGVVKGLLESKDNKRVHYFSNIPGIDNRNLEGSIYFLDLDEGALTNLFSTRTLLTLNYNLKAAPYFDDPMTDFSDMNDRIYGTGFKLQFGGVVPQTIDRLFEYNLEEVNGPATEWSCPSHLKYRVAKSTGDCPRLADNPAGNAEFSIVRSILDPESDDWYINEGAKCISRKDVTKIGSCYGSGDNKIAAPQYVSICFRN